MSIKIMTRVWELDLPQGQKLVLLAFADHSDDTGLSFPSIPYVAWKSGYSERQTRSLVADLRDCGILVPVDGMAGGRGNTTAYEIHMEKGAKIAPFAHKNPAVGRRERVQSATEKGAVSRKKRDRIYKQPSLTIIEPHGKIKSTRTNDEPKPKSGSVSAPRLLTAKDVRPRER